MTSKTTECEINSRTHRGAVSGFRRSFESMKSKPPARENFKPSATLAPAPYLVVGHQTDVRAVATVEPAV